MSSPTKTTDDIASVAKARLANGRHVSDYDVHLLVAEIERLRSEAVMHDSPAWVANERLNERCEIAYRALERIIAEGPPRQYEIIAREALEACARDI